MFGNDPVVTIIIISQRLKSTRTTTVYKHNYYINKLRNAIFSVNGLKIKKSNILLTMIIALKLKLEPLVLGLTNSQFYIGC